MSGLTPTLARLIAAVTLLIAAFLVAPVADAAICAPETPAAQAIADHDLSPGHRSDGGAEHGACSHGHCHHAQGERASGADLAIAPVHARARHDPPRDDAAASRAPDGLKRPPRG